MNKSNNNTSVWNDYGDLQTINGNLVSHGEFCVCKHCHVVLYYGSGIKMLKYHQPRCLSRSESNPSSISIPNTLKMKCRKSLVSLWAGAKISFNTLENEEFAEFCKVLVELGARFGVIVDPTLLFPSITTTRTDVNIEYIKLKRKLIPHLHEALKKNQLSFTTDIGDSGTGGRSLLTVIAYTWMDSIENGDQTVLLEHNLELLI
jgi:hypothetical protein